MITGDLKSKIDGLWEDFWVGGITNPLTVIEQITYLMYSRMLDTQEQRDEKRKQIAGIDFKPRFAPEQQEFRWHCCKVSDEAAFCLIQRPYISKTLLT
ncbi:type I restriction-modification system subunit M N-terminal domain-containing protein, partial [Escherichia coli]|uniref:type I restriction-modification system subunit M N-terminal domain-containing protein n=1 Tax=Escherichia coli TaxID=562 RepID=UPI0024E0DBED